jgi:hypothetical protein
MPAVYLLLAVVAGLSPAQGDTSEFRWREPVPPGYTLEIRGVIGSITARAGSGREADVVGTRLKGHRGDPEEVEIRVIRESRRIIICTIYPRDPRWSYRDDSPAKDACEAAQHSTLGRGENDTNVSYRITVPAGVHFVGQTVTSNVTVEGLNAGAEGYSIAGDVTISGTKGGILDAASISGDIRYTSVDADTVYAGTLSGDVAFSGAIHRAGQYSFLSHTGNITVELPSRAGVTLKVIAPAAEVHSGVVLTAATAFHRRRFAGKVGDGSAQMDITTFNGEIQIQRKD